MKKSALNVAGLIFSAIAIIHILRYVQGWVITFNNFTIPLDWSIYGAIIAGILATFMFFAACKK